MSVDDIQQLVDMGFAREDVKRVLQETGDVASAIEKLLNPSMGETEPVTHSSNSVGTLALRTPTPRLGDRFFLSNPDTRNSLDGWAGDDESGSNKLGDRDRGQWSEPSTSKARSRSTPLPPIQPPEPPLGGSPDDLDLNTALEISMQESQENRSAALDNRREPNMPCGFLNVGNTCYVNSLLQTMFHFQEFQDWMLRFRPLQAEESGHPSGATLAVDSPAAAAPETPGRRAHCIRLAQQLQRLFAFALFSERSCVDPSRLLKEVVDSHGKNLAIGSQEDAGEFMLKLFEQLDEGLRCGSFLGVAADPEVQSAPSRLEVQEPPAFADSAASASAPPASEDLLQVEVRSPTQEDQALQGVRGPQAPDTGQGPRSGKKNKPSLLQTLFFGEQVQVFSYREDPNSNEVGELFAAIQETALHRQPSLRTSCQGELVQSEERSEFLQIFLDVKHGDLYRAWGATSNTEVDYTTPQGSKTSGKTSTWIERLPKLLMFQLGRVVFDPEKKAQVKLDDAFEFDETIYPDRFLLENRSKATEAAARVRALRRRQGQAMSALERFENPLERSKSNVQQKKMKHVLLMEIRHVLTFKSDSITTRKRLFLGTYKI